MQLVLKVKVSGASPKLGEHARSVEVEGAVDPVEGDQEHQDDQDAQWLEKCSLFPPVMSDKRRTIVKQAMVMSKKEKTMESTFESSFHLLPHFHLKR